jgi:hypothetical protein
MHVMHVLDEFIEERSRAPEATTPECNHAQGAESTEQGKQPAALKTPLATHLFNMTMTEFAMNGAWNQSLRDSCSGYIWTESRSPPQLPKDDER